MTITVQLPDSLEQRIRDRAAQLGGDPGTVIANLVRDHFSALANRPFVALTDEETK